MMGRSEPELRLFIAFATALAQRKDDDRYEGVRRRSVMGRPPAGRSVPIGAKRTC